MCIIKKIKPVRKGTGEGRFHLIIFLKESLLEFELSTSVRMTLLSKNKWTESKD